MNATPSPAAAAPDRSTLWSIVIILMGMTILPGMDAIAKALTGIASVSMISLIRNLTQVGLMAPGAWRATGGQLHPGPQLKLHMLRGLCMVGSGMLFFAGVQQLPLADNMAISFVYPLLVALIAPIWLGERLTLPMLGVMLFGFAGVIVIVRPGSGLFGAAALLPLLSALGYAAYVLTTRQLARSGTNTSLMQFWMAVFGALFVLPVMLAGELLGIATLKPHVAEPIAWVGMIGMGIFGSVGHMLVTTGARHVSAGSVAALGYFELIPAAILGWVFFHNVPDHWSMAGAAMIVGSGLLLMLVQRRGQSG